MNYEEQQEYEEMMGSPEMEYLQYLLEHPELLEKQKMKTLKQAEQLTGIAPANLRQRIARKTLKATKKGRDWFISSKELERLEPTNPMPPLKDQKVVRMLQENYEI